MHRAWKIVIVSIVAGIFISSLGYFLWPTIEEVFKPKQEVPKPKVYLTLAELDFTNLMHLESLENEEGLKITISHIKPSYLPKEVKILTHIPLEGANLESYKNQTIFTFSAQNLGQEIATNVVAFIDLNPPNTISNIEILKTERVKIIQGGINSNYVKFSIDTLYPNEEQGAIIYSKDNEVREFSGWSEQEKMFQTLFIIGLFLMK